MVGPVTALETQIFELWKEVLPSHAFSYGVSERAGRFFVPTAENLERAVSEIRRLRNLAETEAQRKFLDSLELHLTFLEPMTVFSRALDAFFDHMIKEGINVSHMLTLVSDVRQAILASRTRFTERKWPVEVKVLTLLKGRSLVSILKTIREESKDAELQKAIDNLISTIRRYLTIYRVKGMKVGNFKEAYPVFKKLGGDIGRKEIYSDIVRKKYDYPERPVDIEAKALRWLSTELPVLRRITRRLARRLKVKPTVEAVADVLARRSLIKRADAVKFTLELRQKLGPVINKHLVKVNPQYETRVVETPPYLVSSVPTAAAAFYDVLTQKPFQLYLVTTDERWAPPAGVADMLQTLVHEEYGHCLNASNSAQAYGAQPSLLELLWTPLDTPVTEGISFYRELEFLNLLKRLKSLPSEREERELIAFLDRHGGFDALVDEYEFVALQWRLMRFLRAIGDVRINLGKQSVAQFIDWAYKRTGLSKNLIYNQIYPPFQHLPGYAPSYSMAGEAIREIQAEAVRRGKSVIGFNTYASSLGFPPRTVFEKRLREFAQS